MKRSIIAWLPLTVALAACAASPAQETTSLAEALTRQVDRTQLDIGPPYLPGPLDNAVALIPPPPEAGSDRAGRDAAAEREALLLRGSGRWELAARDARLGTDAVADAFSCSAGMMLSERTTPAIAKLVKRATADFGMSTGLVKKTYQRTRPFAQNGQPTCTPEAETMLADNGSYPSGHAAIGYGTAMVLSAVFPDARAALTSRGGAFADSRRVCNVHWRSDVEAARPIAEATFEHLMTDEGFAADLAAARAEAAALADDPPTPAPAACDAEAQALAG